jgi:hypothetical protein
MSPEGLHRKLQSLDLMSLESGFSGMRLKIEMNPKEREDLNCRTALSQFYSALRITEEDNCMTSAGFRIE